MKAKLSRLVFVAVSLCLPLFADDAPAPAPAPTPTPVPTMPASIKLTNGVTLRNVSVVRWMRESVTLKHAGGADTIYYSYIAEPDRTTVLAVRDDAIKNHKTDLSAKPVDNSVKGMIMISGAGGEVPLGGVKVYAVPMDALGLLSSPVTRIRLPKPLASGVTGADGQFSMVVPAGSDYFIFAKAQRMVGQNWEHYEWRVPISQVGDKQSVTLTSDGNVPLADQKAVTFE